MNFKQTPLNVSLLAVLGIAGTGFPVAVSAALPVANGNYELRINVTPLNIYGNTKPGTDGNWNSTFSFGLAAPSTNSQPMLDNGNLVTTAGGQKGSSVAGDGIAGKLSITVSGNTFTVNGGYQVDTIAGTAGGNFAQYGSATGAAVGTINQTTGAMTLTPAGRLGAIDGGGGVLYDKRWNVQPADAVWRDFTTGTSTNPVATAGVTGKPLTSLGDINADGIEDWNVILVSAGIVGTDWGGFANQTYIETWNANLVSTAVDTVPNAFTFPSATTVPTSTVITSTPITVSGINAAAPISVAGGSYSINGGAYVTTPGTVTAGQKVRVRHTSSATNGQTTTTTLTIGGVPGTFTSTTVAAGAPADTTPDAFSFTAATNVAVSTVVESNTIQISGITTPASISISGGEYSIDGGPFTSVGPPSTVTSGQTVAVRHTSAATSGATTTTTLTIGGVNGTFTSTTAGAAVPPPPIAPPVVPDAGPPGGGCTMVAAAAPDYSLAGLLLAALGWVGWRRARSRIK